MTSAGRPPAAHTPSPRALARSWRRGPLPALAAALLGLLAMTPDRARAVDDPRATGAPGRPVVTGLRLEAEGSALRLVIESTAPLGWRPRLLGGPDRLVLDGGPAAFAVPGRRGRAGAGPATDAVTGLRHGSFLAGRARVVLDLARPLRVEEQREEAVGGGARTVLRLAPTDRAAFALAVAAQVPAEPPPPPLVVGPGAAPGLPLVVIDPGHGGLDTGALVPGREPEKALVLRFALALRDRLNAGGQVRVALTREDDTFVPLAARARLAGSAGAALFVSLHADSVSAEPGVRGATVYTLGARASDARSARLAERENRADQAAGLEGPEEAQDVAGILHDLAQREARAFSREVAEELIAGLKPVARTNKNPHRQAGFQVLRQPEVPAVLLELGYLSSREDAALIDSPEWRASASAAVATAIERFAGSRLGQAGAPVPPGPAPVARPAVPEMTGSADPRDHGR